MALLFRKFSRDSRGRKASSNGRGGRGRRVKISMSTMNKSYRGQGR